MGATEGEQFAGVEQLVVGGEADRLDRGAGGPVGEHEFALAMCGTQR